MKLFAKKSLGQHFLNSPSVLAKIIEAARISPEETVLEIGPGTGILTEALIKTGATIITVEKDDRALAPLEAKFDSTIRTDARPGKLTLVHADILEVDRTTLGLSNNHYALVANIPYYITGSILETFLEYAPRPNRMVLLVQKEVAERIISRDGKESILSISVKAFGTPHIVATVPPGAFNPPPSVDSAILAIENISADRFEQGTIDIRHFFSIVKTGFAHKRKILKSNLGELLGKEKVSELWAKNGLDEHIRAEDLLLDQWFKLAQ